MLNLAQSLSALFCALCLPIVIFVGKTAYQYWTTPLRHLPGPPNASLIWGHLKEMQKNEPTALFVKWAKEYGPTMSFTGFLATRRLLTLDPKAIAHVLHNAYDYPKPDSTRYNLARMVGPGVLVVEGHHHKMQRKVMNPAFAPSHIKELTATFIDKSIQLRDILAAECMAAPSGTLRTDALSWLNRLTLDIIGLTGFNYTFGSLNPDGKPSELNTAFGEIFSTSNSNVLRILQGWIPILRWIPSLQARKMSEAQTTMSRIGSDLLNESKEFLKASGEKNNWRSRDLLSLLLRANTSSDVPESQRMSDQDVIAQVPTFLVAGHETTASAIVWFLYSITQHQDMQRKLREELLAVPTESPTLDELNDLPYLDAVVRETLRLHAPVNSTIRVANKDDIIPMSKPFTDRNGVLRDCISIKKGDAIVIPITFMNTDPSVWGDDANVFRPERWENVPEAATAFPGVWGNIMTFLGGPRSCIGYRFSLAETKAIIFTLVRAFEFELGVAHSNVGKKAMIVQRPYLKDDISAGNQLPIIIRPYTA